MDNATVIITARATRNNERYRTITGGAGGSARILGCAVAAASICAKLSSQQPNSSATARCNDDSIERRELCINGLKLKDASGWANATQIACKPVSSFSRASISSPFWKKNVAGPLAYSINSRPDLR